MRKYLLLLILVFYSLCASAKEFTITLNGQQLANPLHGYYIEDVILGQQEDSCIGYVNGFLEGTYRTIFFGKNIRSEVKEFLQNSMPAKDGFLPMIVRINRLAIYTLNTGDGSMTRFELSLSFIRKEKMLIEDFTSAVTVRISGNDIPKGLPEIIAEAFDQSILQYIERNKRGLTEPISITSEQLIRNPLQNTQTYKCFNRETSRRGIYRTWIDFRDNKPDTSVEFTVVYHNNKKEPERTKAELKFPKKSKPRIIWGFCDQDKDFVNIGKFYALLTPENNQWTTWFRHSDNNNVTAAAVMGGVAFGLVGAFVFGAIASHGSGNDLEEKSKLDLLGGTLVPVYMKDYTRISSNVVFFLSKISDPDATLRVFVDGQLQCEMKPGNYFVHQASSHHTSATIKLVSSTGGEQVNQIPLELISVDAYLLKVKKNKTINMDKLILEVKKDILKARTAENTVCRAEQFNN